MRTLPGQSSSSAPPTGGSHPRGLSPAALARRWSEDKPGFVASLVSFVVVVGATVFVFLQLQPGLLFGPNMDVGGDTAGHVVAVHYLIHDLLPHGRITGWDPQWFDGFPLYVFYFPLPALLAAAFNLVFPYAVAFKLVTALGSVLMPVAAYSFGRLAGFRRPIPAVMAAGILTFQFLFASAANPDVYVSWNIDGGTIASTMAGEFSFTLGLTCAIFFLGVFTYALRTGRLRWLAAILFLVTVLCHVVPALFAAGAAVILTLVCGSRRSVRSVLIPVGLFGAMLAAFWLLPFGAYLRYSSSMGYGRVSSAYQNLVPQNGEQAVQWLAVVGFALGLLLRQRVAVALGAMAACSGLAFLVLPSGLVYNGRWLPFWFVTTALLAAYAVCEIGRLLFAIAGSTRWHASATGLVAGGASIALIAGWLGVLPGYSPPASSRNPVDGWVTWNYSGYQAKPGWKEFSSLVAMTEAAARHYGCGRLDYEYSPNMTDDYGSTLVPMSFPLWTNGCIDTTEGLYYESSTTTPFHFLDQSQLSIDPSDPVVGIPYQPLDVASGIQHLQLQGVRYFLANSPTVEQAADADPSLEKVGTSPASSDVVDGLAAGQAAPADAAWDLYLIKGSTLVAPLSYEPVVESLTARAFLTDGITWYQDESYWDVPIALSGPATWRREPAGALVSPAQAVPVPPTTVRDVRSTNSSVSFEVSRIGSPVVVKIPYFPNWQASGASGPYEITPNLMVVVPTSSKVELHYGTTSIDWLGKAASVAGIGGTLLLVRPTSPSAAPDSPASKDGSGIDGPDEGAGSDEDLDLPGTERPGEGEEPDEDLL